MLQLTSEATGHLLRARAKRGIAPEASVRLVRRDERIRVAFALRPEPGDQVVDADEITVFVAPEIAGLLDHAVVDVRGDGDDALLVIRRQAGARRSAGQGTRPAARA